MEIVCPAFILLALFILILLSLSLHSSLCQKKSYQDFLHDEISNIVQDANQTMIEESEKLARKVNEILGIKKGS